MLTLIFQQPMEQVHKTSVDTEDQNTLSLPCSTGIYRTLYLTTAEHTFLSSTHGSLTKTNHMLGHKIRFNKFKRMGIIHSMFSDDIIKAETMQ